MKYTKLQRKSLDMRLRGTHCLRVAPARESARGTKANNIVIDSDITNQEIIHCVLRPTLIPLMLVPPKWVMKLFRIKPYRVKRFKRNEYIVNI